MVVLVLSIHASAVFAIHAVYTVPSDLIVCNILCGFRPPIDTLLSKLKVQPDTFDTKLVASTSVFPIVTTWFGAVPVIVTHVLPLTGSLNTALYTLGVRKSHTLLTYVSALPALLCTSNILDVCDVPDLTNTLLFACPEPSPKTRLCKFNWLLHHIVNGVALCPTHTLLLAVVHEPLDIIYHHNNTLLLALVVS